MGSIGFCNVREFNSGNKQSDVRRFLQLNNVGLFGILETRVRRHSINKVHSGLGMNWSMVNNVDDHEGGRIWLIWDPMNYKVELVSSHAQVMHSRVTFLPTGVQWWLSVVYGFNRVADRVPLWESLNLIDVVVAGPWMVMADFNNVLAMDDRIGSEITSAELRGFQNCVANCGLMDAPAQGALFTWNNKHDAGDMVFSRIDRVLINDDWLAQFPDADITFHPEGLYDHCPCTATLWPTSIKRKGSFKFFNMWGQDANFLTIVNDIWDTKVEGFTMFQIAKKHKALKKPLKDLNMFSFSNVETSAKAGIKEAAIAYRDLDAAWKSFLSQKAKVHWMSDGDDNSQFFCSVIKARRLQNRVLCIQDLNGITHTTLDSDEMAFQEYYIQLLV
ncbi:uncharacterized protein LOC141640268 [Silene latifolia]|uniref:uncharacterized protein LOC141640268 n=1 Tax=Silene latifolia TaxID=37657 RepID=UPI003D789FCC